MEANPDESERPHEEEQQDDDATVYGVQVELRQTATINVKADSREEAWDALKEPHDRETDKLLMNTDFRGGHYEPEDISYEYDPAEVGTDLDVTGGEE